MSWRAEYFQVVNFHLTSGEMPDVLPLWLELFKVSPQQYNTNHLGPAPTSQAIGIFGSFQITLSASFGRIDMVLQNAGLSRGDFFIDDFSEAISFGTEIIDRINAGYGEKCTRLALLASLVFEAASQADANNVVRNEIGIDRNIVPDDAHDLNFAFNVRAHSGVKGIDVNRVLRLAVGVNQETVADYIGQQSSRSSAKFAATKYIDVNLMAQVEPMPFEVTKVVWNSITHEVVGIIESGYERLRSAN